VVYDLAQNKAVRKISVFDIDYRAAQRISGKYGGRKATANRLDAGNVEEAYGKFKDHNAVISAVAYKYNRGLATAAIKAGTHFFDLGGNNSVVAEEFRLNKQAKQAGVVIIPDCGLAPGMVSVIAAGDLARFDIPESLHIRVGGLPQKPHPPLNYQMLFSAEGLINEYFEPVFAIRNGRKITLSPLNEVETLNFSGLGKFEAFTTSGGISTLPQTYGRLLKNLDYKTIRYPGHCEKFKTIMDIGLADWNKIMVEDIKVSPRSVLKAVLDKNLSFNEPDMTLVRLASEGFVKGKRKKLISEIVDYFDHETGLTSMMRCTSFPVAIIAIMAASGAITARGVVPQEKAIDPALFEKELAGRNILIRRRWSK
jgi:lysine 6-dehydrogenase